jgi:hypothetical protein
MSLLIGLLAGFFGGMVGLGGGVVMIPLMLRFHGLTQHQAHGTSLMALVFTGGAGAVTYYLKGSVDFLAGVCLAASAVFTSGLGAFYANSLPEWRLKRAFGVFVILVSLLMLAKPYYGQFSHPVTGGLKILVLLGSGAGAGFFSGMMGVGGGSIMVPALVLLVGLSQHTSQGTSLLAMVPGGTVGAVTHWRLGNVARPLLGGLVPGILLGTYLGGTSAHRLSEGALRFIFAAVLIWQGLRDVKQSLKMQGNERRHPGN